MIERFEQAEELFKELDSAMEGKIMVYTIGDAALLKRGLKPVTKDIDLVVSSRHEFLDLQNALVKIGFTIHPMQSSLCNLNILFHLISLRCNKDFFWCNIEF